MVRSESLSCPDGSIALGGGYELEFIKKSQRENVVESLKHIWEASVRASHHFLTEEDMLHLLPEVEGGLRYVDTLLVVKTGNGPVGFMGVQDCKIEMLFLNPCCFRRGIGRKLVLYAFEKLDVEFVDVNEQNPSGIAFYESMGFKVFKRNAFDGEGRPFPILEMKRG